MPDSENPDRLDIDWDYVSMRAEAMVHPRPRTTPYMLFHQTCRVTWAVWVLFWKTVWGLK